MDLPPLVPGRFIRRDNRFRATISVGDALTAAHVPNSGRLTELFTPSRPVWVAPASAPHRKTAFDLKLVEYNSVLVSVDARLPNPLLEEALMAGKLPDYRYPNIDREVPLGASRLDFRLSDPDRTCWIETKSVTLVEDGLAQFPDAPTGRGRRHLFELIAARNSGDRAAVIFVIQRPDAVRFEPHVQADPEFAAALRQANDSGVEVRAFTCFVSLDEITLAREIPVVIPCTFR